MLVGPVRRHGLQRFVFGCAVPAIWHHSLHSHGKEPREGMKVSVVVAALAATHRPTDVVMALLAVPGPDSQQPLVIGARELGEHAEAKERHLNEALSVVALLHHPEGERRVLVKAVDKRSRTPASSPSGRNSSRPRSASPRRR